MKKKFVVYLAHPVKAPTQEGIEANLASSLNWFDWLVRNTDWAIQMPWYPYIVKLSKDGQYGPFRERGLADDCAAVQRADGILCTGGHITGGLLSDGMGIEADHALNHGVVVGDLMHVSDPATCSMQTPVMIRGVAPGQKTPPMMLTVALEQFETMAQRWRSHWFRGGGPHLYSFTDKASIRLQAANGHDYVSLTVPLLWRATLYSKLNTPEATVTAEAIERQPDPRRSWLVMIECFEAPHIPVVVQDGETVKVTDLADKLITGIRVEAINNDWPPSHRASDTE